LIVFDTDLNKLLYYHNDTWKDFGLWSTRDSTSGNIYYNGGKVVVGEGSDTSSTFGTLNVAGNIVCVAVPDSAGEAIHVFISEIDFPGEFNGNFGINTIQTNNTDGGTVGMFSYLESDAKFSVAMGGQSFYTGAGGDLDNFQEIPIVLGSMTDAYVLDTLAEALAIGSKSIAESAHKGINIGNYSSAVSPATYANIGVLAETGDSSSNPIIFIRDSFPSRFTAAALLNNSNNSANDFNVYAHGDAKSFFGGNVGIGTIAPTTKLDVAGTVNAEVYLLNGDTLGDGVWSRSGNHIYFPASGTGKVAIGSGSDTSKMKATLNISGSRGIVSEVTPDSTNGAPAHVFEATLNNATGQNYRLNTIVNTLQGNSGEGISVGFVSYNEGSPENIYAIGGQAFYTGAGGSVDSNLVAGVIGDTYVEDSTAIVSAIGVLGISESNQQGINVGIYGSAYSNDAYFNIGSVALVNIPDAVSPLEIISDSFNTRFTAAGVFRNFNDSVHDFNVYAAGDAQSYFGGNVGIGTIAPTKELDVSGAVNASAYFLNGDSLTFSGEGVWNQSGDDIYYDAGRVSIGLSDTIPNLPATLTVLGNVVMATDTQNFPVAFFSMGDSTGFLPDSENDNTGIVFGMTNSLEDSSAAQLGFRVSYDYEDSSLNSFWAYSDSSKLHLIGVNESFENDEGGILMLSIDHNGNTADDWTGGSLLAINTEGSYLVHGAIDSFGQVVLMTDSIFLLGAWNSTPEFDDLDSLSTFIGMAIDTSKLWLGVHDSEQGKIEITDDGVTIGKLLLDEGLDITGDFIFRSDTTNHPYPNSTITMNRDSRNGSVTSPFPQSDSLRGILMSLIDTAGTAHDTQGVFFAMNMSGDDVSTGWGYVVDEEKFGIISLSPDEGDGGGIQLRHGSIEDTISSILVMNESGINLLHRAYNDSTGSSIQMDSTALNFSVTGIDTTKIHIDQNGFGINTDSPDTELHVNGDTKQKIHSSNVSNPPTDGELDTLFTSPTSKGDGWTAYVKDSNTDNLYQIMVVGADWYIIGTTKAQ